MFTLSDRNKYAVAFLIMQNMPPNHRMVVVRRHPTHQEIEEHAFLRYRERVARGEDTHDASMMDADWLAAEQALSNESVALALIETMDCGKFGYARHLWVYRGYYRDQVIQALVEGLVTLKTGMDYLEVEHGLDGMQSAFKRAGFRRDNQGNKWCK